MRPAVLDVKTLTYCLLFLAIFLSGLQSPVKVNVFPPQTLANGSVRLRCWITRDDRNREIGFGFEGWTSSTKQLEGSDSPAVFEWTYDHAPCGAGDGFCVLKRDDGRELKSSATFRVAGCEMLGK